jgi:hypothetical protein
VSIFELFKKRKEQADKNIFELNKVRFMQGEEQQRHKDVMKHYDRTYRATIFAIVISILSILIAVFALWRTGEI